MASAARGAARAGSPMISTRIRNGGWGSPAAASTGTSAADHTPASTAIAAAPSTRATPAQPSSLTFTEAKSGRAAASRPAQPATAACRAAASPCVIHSPVDTPTGVPGQAARTAATAAPTSAARTDSAPSGPRAWRWMASAPAATAAAASRASSAGVTGTAGLSAWLRLPLRQAFSRLITPSIPCVLLPSIRPCSQGSPPPGSGGPGPPGLPAPGAPGGRGRAPAGQPSRRRYRRTYVPPAPVDSSLMVTVAWPRCSWMRT